MVCRFISDLEYARIVMGVGGGLCCSTGLLDDVITFYHVSAGV